MNLLSSITLRTTLLFVVCTQISVAATSKPRVASLNLCADQLIMLLADPEQIASLSKLSTEEAGSLYALAAARYPQNNATAEDVLVESPDLVIAGAFTVSYTPRLLQNLGMSVETLPLANSIQDAMNNVELVAELLEQQARGDEIIAKMKARLAAMPQIVPKPPRAAVYDANGYTVGAKTMRGEALLLAGWANVAEELAYDSYGTLSLETLIHLWPDAVIEAPYEQGSYSRAQHVTKHPVIGKGGFNPKRIGIPSNKTVCAGPWSLDVIDILIDARVALSSDLLR
ncbi:MAG: ABC transporter substrate-binding protein [Granulosicoccaceae bacterium]